MLDYRNAVPDDFPLTIREKIVLHVQTLLGSLKMDLPGKEDQPLFKTVGRGDPDDDDGISTSNVPLVSIEDAEETQAGEWIHGHVDKNMIMFLHIRFEQNQHGVEPHKVFNYYLGRLQAALLADYRLGGNCKDVNEVASAPQVFRLDALQGGFLQLRISYRHPRNDPYKLQ